MNESPTLATPEELGDDVRPFHELRKLGLLWLINTTVFHPRGYAIGLAYDGPNGTGNVIGWQLFGDGSERWSFGADEVTSEMCDALFDKVKALMP